jgi:hypothetical protein
MTKTETKPIPLTNCRPLILPDTSPRPITNPEGGPPRFAGDTPYGPIMFPRAMPPVGSTFTHEGQTYKRIS